MPEVQTIAASSGQLTHCERSFRSQLSRASWTENDPWTTFYLVILHTYCYYFKVL